MDTLEPSSNIFVATSDIQNAGRGVFAKKNIREGAIIETCPIILLKESDVEHIRHTELYNYYFMWGGEKENHKAGICLGFGSLYNHSYKPNATYKKRLEAERIDFVAITNIGSGEEITVNYNFGIPNDKSKLWIESIPAAE